MTALGYDIFLIAVCITLIIFPVLFAIQIWQSVQLHSLLVKKKANSAKNAIKLTAAQRQEFYLALPRISYLKAVFRKAGQDRYWLDAKLWNRALLTEIVMALVLMGLLYLVVRPYISFV